MLFLFIFFLILKIIFIYIFLLHRRNIILKKKLLNAKKIKLYDFVDMLEPGDIIFTSHQNVRDLTVLIINNFFNEILYHLIIVLPNKNFMHFVSKNNKPFYESYFERNKNSLLRVGKLEEYFKHFYNAYPLYCLFRHENDNNILFHNLIDKNLINGKFFNILNFYKKKTKNIELTCNSLLGYILEKNKYIPPCKKNVNLYYNPKNIINHVFPKINYKKYGIFILE